MRIAQIRLKNLNSLAGEWLIDLTHPAYAADGLFAITGPTGAGKSTLLDAICLALYGRTPRLSSITQGGNEVMSRQTGECFAEVTFTTAQGRYRCHWSQHRARRRADGALQAPRHEIANADSGEILETKLRSVAKQIEAATGMDFERFTRSMLLAQGGFAAFLQAAPDERSPLLEQITGTAIYSRISVRVHERRAAERKTLDTLQAALEGLTPLAAEEEREWQQRLERQRAGEAALARQLAEKTQAIQWCEGLARLAGELEKLAAEDAALTPRIAAFAPDRARLEAANRALELAAEHTTLAALRQAQSDDGAALDEQRAARPACATALEQAAAAVQAAHQRLEAAKRAQQEAQPLLQRVRELDLRLTEQAPPLTTLAAEIAGGSKTLETLEDQHRHDLKAREASRASARTLEELLDQTQADARLVETLSALRERFDALTRTERELLAKRAEIARAEDLREAAAAAWQRHCAELEEQRRRLEREDRSLAATERERQQLLEGQGLADWRRHHAQLLAQRAQLTEASEALDAETNAREAHAALARRQAEFEPQQRTLSARLETLGERQRGLEAERELLETQLGLALRIEDLEAARQQLKEGEPCPLCGAPEHPYVADAARGRLPVPDQTRERLAGLRETLAALSGEQTDTRVAQARLHMDIEAASTEAERLTQHAAAARARIVETCAQLPAELALDAHSPALGDRLSPLLAEHTGRIAHAAATLERGEALEQTLATQRTTRDQTREALTRAERQMQEAAHRQALADQQLARLRQEADEQDTQLQQSLAGLSEELRAYGIATLALDDLDEPLARLTARRDQWRERQRQQSILARELAELDLGIARQTEQIRHQTQVLTQQRAQHHTQEREQRLRREERQSLFADRRVEAEEQRLVLQVTQGEEAWEAARAQHDRAAQALDRQQTRIEQLAQAIEARTSLLQAAQISFHARLEACDFASEAAYQAASLPEPARRSLAQRARELDQAHTELAAQRRDKTRLLAHERQRALTETPLAELRHAETGLRNEQRQLQQEIGAIEQRLADNRALRQRQQAQLAACEAQRREGERWELLHELIGSADGKKYRNFAQGLTFEMMVGHANRQLARMSERYLLIRDGAQPLELNVIDNYQAGETRSTKNLSGGESFIVSLALALGLAQMASHNVRVDSLFLDEGFGTLDEEALDTALETLGGLQQDGTLIGVISHVQALKERIATQIQITPLNGGKSRLSGPGCSRVEG